MSSLATKTVGPPDNSYTWYLHSSGVALSTGFSVSLGDGTSTKLWLDSNGIGFLNAGGFVISLSCPDATANNTLVIHYGPGEIYPVSRKTLTATITATDTTAVAMPLLTFTPVSGATYEIEMLLICTAANTAGALQIVNTGGAGTLYLMDPGTAFGITSTGGSYAPTTSPVAGTFIVMLKGIFIASSTADLTWSIKSDDTNDVAALAGSFCKYTKVS